jgi:hypothetical protein
MGHWIMPATQNICFYYLGFSGGKFLANCLALSRHVVCNHAYLAKEDLEWEPFDEYYYQYKLHSVMTSLSPTFISDGVWKEFPGLDIPETYNRGCGNIVELARQKQRIVCHMAHTIEDLQRFKDKFPDLKIVKLLNFKKFNSLCYSLKSKQPEELGRHKQGFDSWISQSAPSDIDVDMDSLIYDSEQFLPEIKKLYDYFGLDDFRPDLLTPFYDKYKSLHHLP